MIPDLKLLAVRNDRLGDFMLAWPALQSLHRSMPDSELTLLARDYTAPLAALCPGVARVLCDPAETGELANARAIARLLRPLGFDAAVALFSRFDVAMGLMLARIPVRAAPATKLAQVFYSDRLRQRRSHSLKPEWLYNVELVEFFLARLGVSRVRRADPPYLAFPAAATAQVRAALAARLGFDVRRPLAFLHPGHGGSSPTPAPESFAHIGRVLVEGGAALVLSQGPADDAAVAAVSAALGEVPHAVYRSDRGVVAFARHVAAADLFVSGSTGPLHIAGALDVATAAFYPRRRSASALRWQTLNRAERRLAYMPPPGVDENDFAAIDMRRVGEEIGVLMKRVAPVQDGGGGPAS